MTDRPLFQARRTTGARPGREVVDSDLRRVAYIPPGTLRPEVLDRRAGIVAAALMHDSLTAEKIQIWDTNVQVEVWDGGILLASYGHGSNSEVGLDAATARRLAESLVYGYLLARRLCLGERS